MALLNTADKIYLGTLEADRVYAGATLVWPSGEDEVPWTPAEITTGMAAWYDAAEATTLTFSGANLTQWADRSPAANHAIPWTTGPTLTSVNGLGSLYFEYQGLRTTTALSLGDFTAFVVFTGNAPGNYERLLDHSFVNGFWLGRQAEGAVWGGGVRNTSDPYGYYVALANGTPHQISTQRSGATQTVGGNGGAVGSSGAVTTTATSSNYISIGASFDNATSTDMLAVDVVSEVIIWSRALSADDMARTEGYLAHKWGIAAKLPGGHAYKDDPPTVLPEDGLWTPAAMSGLEAWFDTTQDAFADGALITNYTEHSSHARIFTALSGQEPAFRASIAGKPRMEFGGAVRGLTLNPFSASALGLTYVVCDQTIATTYIGMLMTYNGTSASYELRYSDYSLTPMLVANYAANGGAAVLTGTPDPVTTDVVHMAQFLPAGTTSLWRDGNLLASGTTSAAMATTAADLNLGKRSDAAHYLSHYINEALVINGPINVATRQRIEGYLAHKWNTALPVGHPYEDAPPLAYAGPSASLLVSYTPGTDRNDFTGEVGVRLGIGGAAIAVSWIGVRTHAGATGTRTVNLYEWFSGAIQRTATVDLTGHATDEYVWAAITPITLAAGGYYALLMETVASGPIWSNPGATAFMGMTNIYDCYRTGGALFTGVANSQFVGLDLGWT